MAVAFLTELRDEDGDERMWIQRLPAIDAAANTVLSDDGYVERGEEVVVPGLPVEGGVRGFVNGVEVPVPDLLDPIDLPLGQRLLRGFEPVFASYRSAVFAGPCMYALRGWCELLRERGIEGETHIMIPSTRYGPCEGHAVAYGEITAKRATG